MQRFITRAARLNRRWFTSTSAQARPEHVGVLAMDAYFPKRFVAQSELEKYDQVSTGKYTIGLGQERMAFVGDREDINSVAMTAVQSLLDKYKISPEEIGRIEVGTETLVDKSKSTKTHLMELLGDNYNLEGVTCINACYGGTAALFNSVAWVESSAWNGKYALVVAADIAIYEPGAARPTGGCGAVAMLIGPDSPLPLASVRHTHAENCWDFYKPNMESEYPAVDGVLSNEAYLRALDVCYNSVLDRGLKGGNMDSFNHILFHSPYNKLVQKGLGRLLYNDYVRDPVGCDSDLATTLAPWHPDKVKPETTYMDRGLDKALKQVSASAFKAKSSQGCSLSQQVGNTYTAALYVNLLSLVCSQKEALADKKVFMFSYGSGLIATAFAVLPRTPSGEPRFSLSKIASAIGLDERLAARDETTPEAFSEALLLRERSHHQEVPYSPVDSIDTVASGAYYLDEVKENHIRVYKRKE